MSKYFKNSGMGKTVSSMAHILEGMEETTGLIEI